MLFLNLPWCSWVQYIDDFSIFFPWIHGPFPSIQLHQADSAQVGNKNWGRFFSFFVVVNVFQGNERENEVQVGLSMLHWSIKSWTRRKFVFAIHFLLYFRIQLLDAEFVTCSSSNIPIWAVFKTSFGWKFVLGLTYLIIGLSQCMIWVSCFSWNDRCSWWQLSDFVSGAARSNINPNPQKELNPNCFCVSLAWVECSSLIVLVLHGQILIHSHFFHSKSVIQPPIRIPIVSYLS